MTHQIARRLLVSIPTLLVVMLMSVLLVELMPGDPARTLAGDTATPAMIDAVRERLHLNQSVLERFGNYTSNTFRGNLGESFVTGRSVGTTVAESMGATVSLSILAMALAIVIGSGAGAVAAVYRGRVLDNLVSALTAVALAVPAFVVALVLVVTFATQRHWLPPTGYQTLGSGMGGWFKHLILPTIALSLTPAAEIARQSRSALIEQLNSDYVVALRANGATTRSIVFRHALRNAAPPVVIVIGMQIGRILAGAIVVENVFAIPGFGTLAYNAVHSRDLPTIQGVILISAIVVLVANLATDLAHLVLDPRTRSAG